MRGKFTNSRPVPVPKLAGESLHQDQSDRQDGKLAVRSHEAGHITTLGQSTIEALARRGEVPCVRVGRAVLFPVSALREWLHGQAMRNLGKPVEDNDEQVEAGDAP